MTEASEYKKKKETNVYEQNKKNEYEQKYIIYSHFIFMSHI